MSDLQDVIAANAVRAYNEGVLRGEAEEKQRIIKIIEEEGGAHPVGWNYTDWIIALIKGE